MSIFWDILILLALFAILGLAADIAVSNIRSIASALKLKLFALGIVLGLFTTLPELSVGINASIEGAESISVGNIMGGVIVVIGLIMGTSLILNKKVDTKESLKSLFPASIVIISPFLLGIDGHFTTIDGLLMIILYVLLIFYLYRLNRDSSLDEHIAVVDKGKIGKSVVFAMLGVIVVMLSSRFIVEITLDLISYLEVSKLFIGLILFSIGTNLPEISIAVTSWRKKSSALSLSHLISSAFTNILVLGMLSFFNPIDFSANPAYYLLFFFVFLMVALLYIFAKTDRSLSRKEGIVLLLVYIIFVIINIFLA